MWRKPAALFVGSPKVGIYLNTFTIAQSLDLSLIDLERLNLFEVLQLIYFRILAPLSDKILGLVYENRESKSICNEMCQEVCALVSSPCTWIWHVLEDAKSSPPHLFL